MDSQDLASPERDGIEMYFGLPRLSPTLTIPALLDFHRQPIRPATVPSSSLDLEVNWAEILLAAAVVGRRYPISWRSFRRAASADLAVRVGMPILALEEAVDSTGVWRLKPSTWFDECLESTERGQVGYRVGMTMAQLVSRRMGVDATQHIGMLPVTDPRRGGGGKGREADLYGDNRVIVPGPWLIEAKGSLTIRIPGAIGGRTAGVAQLDAARSRKKRPWMVDHIQCLSATVGLPWVAVLIDIGTPSTSLTAPTADLQKRLTVRPRSAPLQIASFIHRALFGAAVRTTGATGAVYYRDLNVWVGLTAPVRELVELELDYADQLASENPDITLDAVVEAVDREFAEQQDFTAGRMALEQVDNLDPGVPTADVSVDSLGRFVALGEDWAAPEQATTHGA